MADLFWATHKPTGTPVVLKQLRGKNPPLFKKQRMAREIAVGRLFSHHPHAMPVWDADPKNAWFIMPRAQQNAADCREELADPSALRELVENVCSVLSAAHAAPRDCLQL
ncbi:hypothetical protein [Streptomyces phaeoluteigriseus]